MTSNYSRFTLGILLSLLCGRLQDRPAPPAANNPRAAIPQEPIAAILDTFTTHAVVCIGDAHGDRLGEAFQLALIRDPRFPGVVNDVVIETGNSRYQSVVDRFVNGEDVPQDALERVWLDTTQQQAASRKIPDVVAAVRGLNASLPPQRRLRVLVGEPPIRWEDMNTADDVQKWEADPKFDRDGFGAALIAEEVVAKKRRALVLYGAGHFFRKPRTQSIVTILEAAHTPVFSIWTNVAAELSKFDDAVAAWKAPSLATLRGTILGRVNMSVYLGPAAGDVSPEWLAPIEDQFDAVLYLGPLSTITFERPASWPCSDPALNERVRRGNLQRPGLGDRVKQTCAQG
jgi:hypothetical protein